MSSIMCNVIRHESNSENKLGSKVKLPPVTVHPGRILRRLSEHEVAESVERWLDCFGVNRAGVNTDAFMWHVFSFERFPSVQGVAAQEQYQLHEAPEYIVVSNDRDEGFTTDVRPTDCSLADWLVFPQNLAWTMAFTHEDGWLGPFFALNPRFKSLNAQNLAKIRKAREADQIRPRPARSHE